MKVTVFLLAMLLLKAPIYAQNAEKIDYCERRVMVKWQKLRVDGKIFRGSKDSLLSIFSSNLLDQPDDPNFVHFIAIERNEICPDDEVLIGKLQYVGKHKPRWKLVETKKGKLKKEPIETILALQ